MITENDWQFLIEVEKLVNAWIENRSSCVTVEIDQIIHRKNNITKNFPKSFQENELETLKNIICTLAFFYDYATSNDIVSELDLESDLHLDSTVYATVDFVTTIAFLTAYYPKDVPLTQTNFSWTNDIIDAVRSGVELSFFGEKSRLNYRQIVDHLICVLNKRYALHIENNRNHHPIFSLIIGNESKAISLTSVVDGEISALHDQDKVLDTVHTLPTVFVFDQYPVINKFKIHLLHLGNLTLNINKKLLGRADAAIVLEEVLLAISQNRLELSDSLLRVDTIFKEDTLAQAINRFRTSLKTNYNLQCNISHRKGSKSVFDIRSLGFSVLILKSPTGA